MFHISLDHKNGEPMYLQIYRFLATEIKTGHLNCNVKLPSGRELAQDLGVSRNTINMAYEQLESEGYIEAVPKRGYFVRKIDELMDIHGIESVANSYAEPTGPVHKKDPASSDCLVDFSPFGIDLAHAPYARWQKVMKETMLDNTAELFQNGDSQGDYALRETVRDYLHRSRGVNCSADQIIIGAGTDYLLMLLTRLLPGYSEIGMENPVYQQAYRVFQNFNYKIHPIPLDENGLQIASLRETGAKLVFVTPSHQFPLGIVMPVNRRLQLLNWAYEEVGRYIIEDDYDSEFRYQGKPIPALQGMDTQGRVIYMGTLSKAIAPSIRIGYVVLPPELCEVYHTQASFLATTVSRIDQEILRRFIAEGYFERHLNRMRSVYRGKHDGILELLSPWKDCICDGYSAGVHLLLKFPAEKYRESELVRKAAEAGIVVYPLSAYYITGKPEQPTILLGYARLTDEEMKQGIQVLQDTWQMHND